MSEVDCGMARKKQEPSRVEEKVSDILRIYDKFMKKMKEDATKILNEEEKTKQILRMLNGSGEFFKLNDPTLFNKVLQRDLPMESDFSLIGMDSSVEDMLHALILDKLSDNFGQFKTEDDDEPMDIGKEDYENSLDELYASEDIKLGDYDLSAAYKYMTNLAPKDIVTFTGRGTANSSFQSAIESRKAKRLEKEGSKEEDDESKEIDTSQLGT